jgi:hypothetical protein
MLSHLTQKEYYYDWYGTLVRFERYQPIPDRPHEFHVLATDNYFIMQREWGRNTWGSSFRMVTQQDLPLYLDRKYKSEEFMRLFK